MKFLCIGSGSIGKRHMRNLLSIGFDPSDIVAVDPREDRLREVKDLGISTVYSSFEKAINSGTYDAAIVCSPTSMHIDQGIELANRGVHMLMEKPLAHNLEGINELKSAISNKKVTLLMAYIFRFSPLTKKVKELLNSGAIGKVLYIRGEFSEYLPDWHPYEDYRSYYMAEKEQGGGSILDQSHIMDMVHHLFGSFDTVFALNGNLSELEVNSDDYSELAIRLKNGIIASIHTDIFGRDHKKQLEIKGESGNILWNPTENLVSYYNAEEKVKYQYNKFSNDFNLNYIEELNHFISCIQGKEVPLASLEDGIETMELILSAYESVKTGSTVKVKQY